LRLFSPRLKAVEVLSHLSKRVRPNLSLPLPVFTLVRLATQPHGSPFQRNFAAAYLEMGVCRLPTPHARGAAGAAALGALAAADPAVAPSFGTVEASLCAVALHALSDLHLAHGHSATPHRHVSDEPGVATPAIEAAFGPCGLRIGPNAPAVDAARAVDFLLDVLLAPPLRPGHVAHLQQQPEATPRTAAISASAGGAAAAGPAAPAVAWPIPAGLSPRRLRRLCGKALGGAAAEAWGSVVDVERRKLSVLRFVPPRGEGVLLVPTQGPPSALDSGRTGRTPSGGEGEANLEAGTDEWSAVCLGPGDALPLLLAASVDASGAVAEAGLAGLASLRASDTARSALADDAASGEASSLGEPLFREPLLGDDARVAEALLALFLGDLSKHGGPRSPLTPNLRSAILRWLLNDCPVGLARSNPHTYLSCLSLARITSIARALSLSFCNCPVVKPYMRTQN
jgi:hypothetical protein